MQLAVIWAKKPKIESMSFWLQSPDFSYDPQITEYHSHIPLVFGIQMKKNQTFNEDPDGFQVNDPVFSNFYFRIRHFPSICPSEFLFLHSELCDLFFPPASLQTFRIKHLNWLLWCPPWYMGPEVWEWPPWVLWWLASSSPLAISKERGKEIVITWNPGHIQTLGGKPSEISALCSLKIPFSFKTGKGILVSWGTNKMPGSILVFNFNNVHMKYWYPL